ncbi:MAG: GNAT family N-acetyltransferase [Cyclobacteriaceae bacterium]
MSKITFKEASIEDLSVSLEIIPDFYQIDNYPFDRIRAERNFREIIDSENLGKFWLLKRDETTVGYLILTFGYSFEYGGRDAFIDELYLKKEFRGKGYGKQVMEILDGKAVELEVRAIHLEVETANKRGNRLYIKSGYTGNHRSLLTKILIK